MSRSHILFLLLLSILLGIAAVIVAKQWMDSQAQVTTQVEEVTRHPVVVAAVEIPSGTIIEAKHLTTKQLEEDWLHDDAYLETAPLIGQVAAATIYNGEPVHRSRIAKPGEGATLAALIPENKRAVTIRVNDVIGVAGFLLPGNKVDVLNTVVRKNYANTTTVLRDIRVLAVDQTAKTDDNKPVIVRAVTLEVSPKEAEKLLTAQGKGEIQLALRNPYEPNVAPPKAKAKPRYVAPSVTILKGTESDNVKVKN
ncbi:hypothetical protein VST7929_01807 [Vibrio stylophorae]|uniref:SAF domain-containing protein n=1 Tax=Vibrio stylophorae TaxID=659351 RepID=A0ABM8ZUE7_9VIBR|nr:Flp pilus assembly protein CpaB [Vibrio stylophorae]CAH0533930.1 hypothetical protein VST7929_01807 [Vibrio stylophorae]